MRMVSSLRGPFDIEEIDCSMHWRAPRSISEEFLAHLVDLIGDNFVDTGVEGAGGSPGHAGDPMLCSDLLAL